MANGKERTMQHTEEKRDLQNLTEARRWLNGNGLERFELPDPERERRVEVYARQFEVFGRIVTWLPPSEPCKPSYRSRFVDGDILRRHARTR
jgi:hypothetical protein